MRMLSAPQRAAERSTAQADEPMQLQFAVPDIGQEEIDRVTRCLQSGWLTTGAECKEFDAPTEDRRLFTAHCTRGLGGDG